MDRVVRKESALKTKKPSGAIPKTSMSQHYIVLLDQSSKGQSCRDQLKIL